MTCSKMCSVWIISTLNNSFYQTFYFHFFFFVLMFFPFDKQDNMSPEDVRKEWAAKIPLKRGGTPEDIAKVCVFLASDLSAYVTGQTIHVCGGMNM